MGSKVNLEVDEGRYVSIVEIRLLGLVEVTRAASTVVLAAKERALLTVLALRPGEVVSADRLIEALWGESLPPSALNSLHSYVSKLRRALGPDTISTRSPGYVLAIDPEDVDAVRFLARLAEGRAALAAGRPEEGARLLEEALRLWRGAALADFTYDRWAQAERARLEEMRLVATEERAEADLALGRHGELVGRLQSLVIDHPLRERLWGQLMLALYRSGRQAEALRAFQSARVRLGEELGIVPNPALRRLEADILTQAPSLAWVRSQSADDADRATSAGTAGGLVGRRPEMALLQSATRRLRSGGQIILVSGEPGIGKTRLLEELAEQAHEADLDVVWGRCYEGGGAPAFWPWVQVLTAIVDQWDPDAVRAILGDSGSEIARIAPAVGALVQDPGRQPAAHGDSDRFRLYESVSGFLLRLAAVRPLVVAIEDIHWADAASLALLIHLSNKVKDSGILIATTFRDSDPRVGGSLADALGDLARKGAISRLELGGLDRQEASQLLAAVVGDEPSAEVVDDLHSRTQGNPFYLGEMAQLLRAEATHPTVRTASAGVCLPAGVRDVIRRRVGRLPEGTQELLTMAAVFGHEFDVDVLLACPHGNRDATLNLMTPALEAGVLVDTAEPYRRYRFSHALVNETIYDDTTSIRRAELHRRAGAALEQVYGENDPNHAVEVAHHFYRAVPAGSAGEAFARALRAAEAAEARLAYEQADEQLRRAVELARLLPPRERTSKELAAQVGLSKLLTRAQGYAAPGVGEASARIRELCRAVDDPGQVASALWGVATHALVTSDLASAGALGKDLEARGNRSDNPLLILAGSSVLGLVALSRGELVTADGQLDRTITLASRIDDRSLLGLFAQHPASHYRSLAALVAWLRGDSEVANRLAAEAIGLATDLHHEFSLGNALLFDAVLAAFADDADRAWTRANQTVSFSERLGFGMFRATAVIVRGWAAARRHEAEDAEAEMKTGLAFTAERGSTMFRSQMLGLLADAQRVGGRLSEALVTVQQALDHGEATGARFWDAELHRIRAQLLALTGHEAQAADSFDRAVQIAADQGAVALEKRASDCVRAWETAARSRWQPEDRARLGT